VKKMLPPTLWEICLVLMFFLRLAFPIRFVFAYPYNLLGFLPILAGVALNIMADSQFKREKTNVKTFNEPDRLVTIGLFRYCRNPMYLGFTLLLVGGWILSGAASPLLGVLIFALAADRWYIPFEEKRLLNKFGQSYIDYRKKTPRWI